MKLFGGIYGWGSHVPSDKEKRPKKKETLVGFLAIQVLGIAAMLSYALEALKKRLHGEKDE